MFMHHVCYIGCAWITTLPPSGTISTMARGVLDVLDGGLCSGREHGTPARGGKLRSIPAIDLDMESLDSPTYPGAVALPAEIVVACG